MSTEDALNPKFVLGDTSFDCKYDHEVKEKAANW